MRLSGTLHAYTPGGSPVARGWQVNVPLTRNNDLPYGFFGARGFCYGPDRPRRSMDSSTLED